MTHKIGNVVFIIPEADRACELCGTVTECRPYGPGGKQVCWDCGDKDEASKATRDAAIDRLLDDLGDTLQ